MELAVLASLQGHFSQKLSFEIKAIYILILKFPSLYNAKKDRNCCQPFMRESTHTHTWAMARDIKNVFNPLEN